MVKLELSLSKFWLSKIMSFFAFVKYLAKLPIYFSRTQKKKLSSFHSSRKFISLLYIHYTPNALLLLFALCFVSMLNVTVHELIVNTSHFFVLLDRMNFTNRKKHTFFGLVSLFYFIYKM